ncbi:MAG: hypothetical protein SGILL_006109 [Bacillariaceae sp.]
MKERYSGSSERSSELIVCSDRVLQKDYKKCGKTAQALLDERKDLPPYSLKMVEEVLAHELSKLSVNDETNRIAATQIPSAKTMSCEAYAKVELAAAKVSECMYERKEGEARRGSRLGLGGFSWLSQSLQQSYQNRCVQEVAREFTSREFGKAEAKICVGEAWKSR